MDRTPKLPESVAAMLKLAAAQRGTAGASASVPPGRQAVPAHPDPDPDPSVSGTDETILVLSPEELLEECAREPETDIGNARRLLIRHGERIRHVTHVGWHGFDGRRWKEDASGAVVRRLAHQTAEFIDDEALMLDATIEERQAVEAGRQALVELKAMGKVEKGWDLEKLALFEALEEQVRAMLAANKARAGRQSARHGHAKSAAGTSKINNMLTEAGPYVSVEVNDLNVEAHAFNCASATLRFVRGTDGRWQARPDPHRESDLISKLADVPWDPRAQAPLFSKFLQQIQPDPDMRSFLQRYFGLCLTGIVSEQVMLFLHGAGSNGKSTLVDLIAEVMGDYAVAMSIDSFAGDSKRAGAEATPDLARLPGARLVAASEPEQGVKLKDALIKTLTGDDVIPVRRLNQDFFELKPQFKIVLSGNHKPDIRDDSDGIWRRVLLIPFSVQFADGEKDTTLPARLRTEKPGILAWQVAGALDYLNGGLRIPEGARAATSEYREESDPLGSFIRHACAVTGDDADRCNPRELFDAYSAFASQQGLSEFRFPTFAKRFPDQSRKSWPDRDGMMRAFRKGRANGVFYYGIRVRDEFAVQGQAAASGRSWQDAAPFPEDWSGDGLQDGPRDWR